MTLNLVPISLNDPCLKCGGKWSVVNLDVAERMALHIGKHWVAECSDCHQRAVVMTFKQEKALKETRAKHTKPQFRRPEKRVSPGPLPDPRLTLGGDCANADCQMAFCPTHSTSDTWAGIELLVDDYKETEFWREQNGL